MAQSKTRKKRKLGSYPFLSVTFSISLALVVIGLFGLLLLSTNKLKVAIQENLEVQVYLKKGLTQGEKNRIRATLSARPYVLSKDNAPSVTFISQDEAAEQFIKDTGEDFTELLGDNPLRDLFVLNIETGYQSIDSLKLVEKDIIKIGGVFEVNYVESLVSSINENVGKIAVILIGFAVILFVVVVILINNTIKLALFSQRFLIRSMQLIGATSAFIKNPFLFRSVLYGGIAGGAASGVLYALTAYLSSRIEELQELLDPNTILLLFSLIVILGILVAFFSTNRSVNKYLKVSLDELY